MIRLLRVIVFSGLILLLLVGVPFAAIMAGASSRSGERESAFHRLLREYDFKARQVPETASEAVRRQSFEKLDGDLDRLEKRAEGVESWLSVLKRRRQLGRLDFRYEAAYAQSARRAAEAFPYSEPIAAVYAAARIRGAAITPEIAGYLRDALPLLASRFAPARLSLHVLLGDFGSPERAEANVPLQGFAGSEFASEAVFADLTILKILAGEIPAAAADIQSMLASSPDADAGAFSPGLLRLAAEFYYDFGDMVRSAQFFSMLPGESALSRQADALWLAGYGENARVIWKIQAGADPAAGFGAGLDALDGHRTRAFYNLAITAPTEEEEAALLQQLAGQDTPGEPSYCFGLIRLSRLMEPARALPLLDASKAAMKMADPLIDLEMLKRRTESGELARMFAETWLLLDKHPQEEDLYHWAAWYFNLQRNPRENAILLEKAARNNFSGDWAAFYGGLQYIHDGNFNAAESRLLAAASGGDWAAFANLGRVLETRYAPARAIEHYERAMAALNNASTAPDDWELAASRVQVRIAMCLKSMSRTFEARLALESALDFNPDNLTARLELARL